MIRNNTECVSCPLGTYQPLIGKTSSAACRNCMLGSYCEAGSSKDTQCPRGFIYFTIFIIFILNNIHIYNNIIKVFIVRNHRKLLNAPLDFGAKRDRMKLHLALFLELTVVLNHI